MSRAPIDIEALLVWAYRDQQVERDDMADGAGYLGGVQVHGGRSADVHGAISALMYGCAIDGGGGGGLSAVASVQVHDDALLVHGTVRTLPRRVVELVRRHARTGTRPDWLPGARTRLAAVLDDRGKPVVSTAWSATRRRIPQYCRVHLVDLPSAVNRARQAYAEWHDALALLAGHFGSRPQSLVRWRVAGFAAPPRPADPWLLPPVERRQTIADELLPDVAAYRSAHQG